MNGPVPITRNRSFVQAKTLSDSLQATKQANRGLMVMVMTDESRISPVEEARALRQAACDWRLSRGAIGVYAVILEHCNAAGQAFPGPALIARKARLAVTNVKACIGMLEELKYIEVERPGLRKKNRYRVTFRQQSIRPRLAGIPSSLKAAAAKKKANSSRVHTQLHSGHDAPTGYAGMHSTGYAGVNKLGMPARQEVAFKSLSESTCASRSDLDPEKQEQERSPEEEARLTASARKIYVEAMEKGHQLLMESTERNHWHRIADLIPKDRLPPLTA